MEKLLKQSGLIIVSLMIVGSANSYEADPNMANTQRICACFEKTGTANCQALNASNTEEANRQSSSSSGSSGDHRQ